MRLTTLARKVQVTPTKLMSFLADHNIETDNGINTKLDQETVSLVMDHFAIQPDEEETYIEEETAEAPGSDITDGPEAVEEEDGPVEEVSEPEQQKMGDVEEVVAPLPEKIELPDEPKTGTIEDLEEGNAEDIDLIKVKKVKLEGIKVVGKIDLPEKPKKEAPKREGTEAAEDTGEKPKSTPKQRYQRNQKRKSYQGRKNRRPLTYEEKLKREEKEKQRRIKQKLKKEKERKKAHYEQTVKAKAASKSKKKKKKATGQNHEKAPVVRHKNPIRRFWAWLNGEYDRF